MAKKYVSLNKLSTFLDNLKKEFATIIHTHTISDITDYKVDSELLNTSTNPVQNKVLNAEFDAISAAMNALESVVDDKVDKVDGKGLSTEDYTTAEKTKLAGINNAGSATNPVYFDNGVPVATTHTLGASVPANAIFTDSKINREPVTTNGDYPILLSRSSVNSTVDTTAVINNNIKANPSEGSIYVKRLEVYGTAKADGAYAGGLGSFAHNIYSFAHGQNVTASNTAAFAHGNSTEASGAYSTAEGDDTTASGTASHAEGCETTASKHYAHAEGYQTTADGNSSHAEGDNTLTKGESAHAEGYYTIAQGNFSHVQGKYNVVDSGNDYAHIVGNGTSDDARSNAHTLDWDGNAWFAGDVYAGGTSQNNAEKLVKSSDINGKYLPITGGKLTGNLMIDVGASSAISLFSPANSEGEQGYGRIYKNASATADYGLQLRDYTYGNTSNSCALVVSNNKTNVADMLQFANQVDGGSNTYYRIYGEHNKPLPADIGAAASNHKHNTYVDSLVTYYGSGSNMTADDLLVPSALIVANSEFNVDLYNVIGGSFAYVLTFFYSSVTTTSRRMQVAMSYNSSTPRMAIRHYAANGWTPWARLVTTAELNTAVENVKAACLPKVTSITLRADYWVFSANAYYQDVPLSCATATSKVDLQPTYYQLAEWQTDGLAFTTESKKQMVRVWVTDVMPKEDITIQVTVQEVLEV